MRRREIALVAGAGLGELLVFLAVRRSLSDDAYISLAYAKNLALHLHWGLIPQETANTATSPLNEVLLAAASEFTRIGGGIHPVLALGGVSVAVAMTLAWGWTRLVRALRLPFATAVVGTAAILVDPFALSAAGMEVLLIPTLLVLLLAMALEGRSLWFGVVAGLAILARLDLIVLVVPVALAAPAVRRSWGPALAATTAVAGPWFLVSWVALGSALPDTLVIKASQASWGVWTYLTGPVMYFTGQQPAAVVFTFLPALAGLLALAAWLGLRGAVRWDEDDNLPPLGPAAALAGGGVAYYALYVALGVNPYHWYYVTPVAALTIFFAVVAGAWLQRARARPRLRIAVPAVALSSLGVMAAASLTADLAHGVPWRSPVISGNWAMADDYARIGVDLRRRVGSAAVESPGEIGTLAYFCECAILDEFSERGRAVQLVNDRINRSGLLTRTLLRVNYAQLDRTLRPRRARYRLRFDPGTGAPPPGAVVWRVWSPLRGTRYLMLTRA